MTKHVNDGTAGTSLHPVPGRRPGLRNLFTGVVLASFLASFLVAHELCADQCDDNNAKFKESIKGLMDRNQNQVPKLIQKAVAEGKHVDGLICDEAAKQLITLVKEPDIYERVGTVYFVEILGRIGHLGEHEEEAVQALLSSLEDPDDHLGSGRPNYGGG